MASDKTAIVDSNNSVDSFHPLSVLFLYHRDPRNAGTIDDHLVSFKKHSRHEIYGLGNIGELPSELDLSRFDAIVIHYTIAVFMDQYLSPSARRRIREFDGTKAVFVQDEYRLVNRMTSALRYLDIDLLFTLAPEREIEKLFPSERLPGVTKINVLAGYVPQQLIGLEVPSTGSRPIDVGYRARKTAPWIGRLSQEKWWIAQKWLKDAPKYTLVCDVSWREEERFYGDAWIDFLTRCKAVLGTESGSSVCDFTGDIQRNVEQAMERDPRLSFEEVYEQFLKGVDGKIILNIISPRCFEAACLKTLMILYAGEYSGILEPWRHYVPLAKDHNNMNEVVKVLRDTTRRQAIIENAYNEIALNEKYSYNEMIARFDHLLSESASAQRTIRSQPYIPEAFGALVLANQQRIHDRTRLRRLHFFAHKALFKYLLGPLPQSARDYIGLKVRVLMRVVGRLGRFSRAIWTTIKNPHGRTLLLRTFLTGRRLELLPMLAWEVERVLMLRSTGRGHDSLRLILNNATGQLSIGAAETKMDSSVMKAVNCDSLRVLLENDAIKSISWVADESGDIDPGLFDSGEHDFRALTVLARNAPRAVARLIVEQAPATAELSPPPNRNSGL